MTTPTTGDLQQVDLSESCVRAFTDSINSLIQSTEKLNAQNKRLVAALKKTRNDVVVSSIEGTQQLECLGSTKTPMSPTSCVERLKNLDKWWFSALESGEHTFTFRGINGRVPVWNREAIAVDRDDLRQAYSTWMRNRLYEGAEFSAEKICKRLRELCPQIEDRRRRDGSKQIWTYVIPSLPHCRAEFCTFMNSEINWRSHYIPGDFSDI